MRNIDFTSGVTADFIWFVFYKSNSDGWRFNPAQLSSLRRQYFPLKAKGFRCRSEGRTVKIN